VKRDAELGFPVMTNFDGSSVLAQVGAFQRYKKRIQVLLHGDLQFQI
jgi:hypothetical protein